MPDHERAAGLVGPPPQPVLERVDDLAQLTDSAPIGIFRINADGAYVYVNARWTEITGFAADEAVGRHWSIVLTAEGSPTEHGPTPFAQHDGPGGAHRPPAFEFETTPAAGTGSRVARGTVRPQVGENGSVRGWAGTLSDVTDEVRAKQMLIDAHDAALATTLMQHNFTTSASHELRTPMTAIIGFIEEVLDDDDVSRSVRDCLDVAYRSALRLSVLIDDLLVLGQEESGTGMVSLQPTAVAELAETVVASFSASAEHAGITLLAEVRTDADAGPLCALAEPVRLEQALDNLVSNALKFTPPGGRVEVGLDTADDSVLITVEDTGIGIESEALHHVFNQFYRARAATEAGTKGTGLGLAISKQLIEAQGGRLTVTSQVGTGSTFTITLPRDHRPACGLTET